MATVFISHAGVDTASARLVERWLVEDRHTVRLDRSADGGIPIGDEWRQRLNGWLRGADAMVCIVTAAYVASPWCAYEIGAAVTRGCRVLPCLLFARASDAVAIGIVGRRFPAHTCDRAEGRNAEPFQQAQARAEL